MGIGDNYSTHKGNCLLKGPVSAQVKYLLGTNFLMSANYNLNQYVEVILAPVLL